MSTGQLWTSLQQENSNNIRKWLYGSVLVRDWNPNGSTSLAGFTPFATDGNLLTTLLSPSNPGGQWFDVGMLDEAGVDFTPKYKTTDTYIWQSRLPQRNDADGDGEEVMFAIAETNPVALCLWNNLPLSTIASSGLSIGSTNFQIQYSIVPQVIFRQIMVIGVDGENQDAIYVSEIRPRVSLANLDKRQMNAKKIDDIGLRFSVYVDPASGFAKNAIYSGPGWFALGGPVTLPELSSTAVAPVVDTASILSPTISITPSGAGGTLAAGTYYWVLTSTNSNGQTVRSNEVTATVSGSTSSAAINWSVVPGATGYKLYRGTGVGAENALITTVGSGATVTTTDTGSAGSGGAPPASSTAVINAPSSLAVTPSTTGGNLPAGATYWVVTAKTAAGETTVSNEVNSTLTGSTSSASLSWSAVTGATSYNVYRGSASGAEQFVINTSATSVVDTGTIVTAAAIGSGKATLVFNQPSSPNSPFTYAVQVSANNGVSYSAATVASTAVASGVVTVTVSGLTATNVDQFLVTATAVNNQTATYPASNSVTVS